MFDIIKLYDAKRNGNKLSKHKNKGLGTVITDFYQYKSETEKNMNWLN